MSALPRACPECLRHIWLLHILAPALEDEVATVEDTLMFLMDSAPEELVRATTAAESKYRILARLEALSEAKLKRDLDGAGCWATCLHDERYPAALRENRHAPPALIGRGDPVHLAALDPAATVTVVGSRRASSYGREVARTIGRDLARAGVTVVSGLSFGIDAAAHRGALESEGLTVAVLGSGPDHPYPAAHRSLWRRICEKGLVLSELPPGAIPWRWSLSARRAVMAALGAATVVVEASEDSGSVSTARLAGEYGRVAAAVPGPVTSRTSPGPNALLVSGAQPVRGAEDVLAGIGHPAAPVSHPALGLDL